MNLLITGHTGFVGCAVVTSCQQTFGQSKVRLVGRRCLPWQEANFVQKQLRGDENYSDCLQNIDVVVHCAARVHVMQDDAQDALAEYRAMNVVATVNLAKQAAAAGVKRFIFISSIKVNGESTTGLKPFTAFDQVANSDPYGISKAEAESALKELAKTTGMEVVIIRPPLVYGPGVKANFASLLRVAQKNLPLPLGAIRNKRSMVALDNLVDLIMTCIDHPNAANQTFLVSDDHDLSTTELLKLMTQAAGKKPRLLPIPMGLIVSVGKLLGKQNVVDRLCGDLQVDIEHTKQTLAWKPPHSVDASIKRCL